MQIRVAARPTGRCAGFCSAHDETGRSQVAAARSVTDCADLRPRDEGYDLGDVLSDRHGKPTLKIRAASSSVGIPTMKIPKLTSTSGRAGMPDRVRLGSLVGHEQSAPGVTTAARVPSTRWLRDEYVCAVGFPGRNDQVRTCRPGRLRGWPSELAGVPRRQRGPAARSPTTAGRPTGSTAGGGDCG